jgi:nucleotide-binding universal stress UspA family protein
MVLEPYPQQALKLKQESRMTDNFGRYIEDGPIYMIVADETEEFDNALRHASRSAKAAGGNVAILYVTGEPGFLNWGKVEERVRAEQREEGERFLKNIAARVYEIDGLEAILFLEEGDRVEAILRVIERNPQITRMILGGDTSARNPGPLVSYFSGKGMSHLPVPLTIIPDHITPEKIDRLV